jgi:hypothetical protein
MHELDGMTNLPYYVLYFLLLKASLFLEGIVDITSTTELKYQV